MNKDTHKFEYSDNFAEILATENVSIVLSAYHDAKLIFVSAEGNQILQSPVGCAKPMGIGVHENKLAVANLDKLTVYAHSERLANLVKGDSHLDTIYFPRTTFYTGPVDVHDISFGRKDIWAVNTKFSCLVTFDINHSYTPRWKPHFISELRPEDRCHLNGLAMQNGEPAYVTALSQTDDKEGWRADIVKTGVILDVQNNRTLLSGLAMPHSPRLINNKLYFLQSAIGELSCYNPEDGTSETLYNFDAFVRGMAASQNYIYVAYSKIRETSKTFAKLPVASLRNNSGVFVYDIREKKIVSELIYNTGISEIYDIQTLPNTRRCSLITEENPLHRRAVSMPGIAFVHKIDKNINETHDES